MRKMIYLLIVGLSVIACGPEKHGHDVGEVLFKNEYSKVIKVSLAPGEEQPVHMGAPRIIYSLNDYQIKWEENSEDKGIKVWQAGDVHYHDKGPHRATNNGESAAEFLVFARLKKEMPSCEKMADGSVGDISEVNSEVARVLFENDQFKVTRVTLEKGVEVAEHAGYNRLVYSLSDYTVNFNSAKENIDNESKTFHKGDVHWHDGCTHSIANKGDQAAVFLIVAFK